MASRILKGIKQHSLISYFVLAFGISWVATIPLIAAAHGLSLESVSPYLHYLVLSGPMLAAIIIVRIERGADGIKELLGRLLRWRVGIPWLLAALFSPVALFLLVAAALGVFTGSWLEVGRLEQTENLPQFGLVPTWIIMTLAAVEEEVGWRGYALPRLQTSKSALSATLILGVFWAIWHLPMFFYRFEPNPIMMVGFSVGVMAGAIILTWLYNSTRGSVLMVALWHGAWSTVAASEVGEGEIQAIMSVLFIVWATVVVIMMGAANLSRFVKHTA